MEGPVLVIDHVESATSALKRLNYSVLPVLHEAFGRLVLDGSMRLASLEK